MDSLDQYIQGVVTKEIYEPENYIRTIQNSLDTNDRHRKYFNLYKVAIIVICLLCTSGIAYATYNYVKNNFNRRKGIETAINNGYIMNVDGEPVTSNDVSLKINQILLDDYNLDISFGLEFKNMEIPDNVQAIKFESMLITDESNNILYHSGNKEIFDEFVTKHNLNVSYKEYTNKYINSGLSINIIPDNKSSFMLACNLSPFNATFPKSTKYNIYIENIVFSINNTDKVINANWNLESSLTSDFQNRNLVKYTCQNLSDYNNIVNVDVVTYTTGTNLKIEMKMPTDKTTLDKLKELIRNSKNSYDIQNTEYYDGDYITENEKFIFTENERIYNFFNDIYIENSKGEKFNVTNNTNVDNILYRSIEKDYILYTCTFDMTTYNCSDNITLHFSYDNKDYSISLVTLV